ncbi:hypothetical protein [Synechococcus phage S-B28]|uniref:Antirestriction protein n=1 Tax=Synechococcus phage S-B28 TaxID=2545435 RepID=A0A482IF12_9CAUD|nr:hypothetical protein HOV28_gp49 [Synechococcus phage S-B28]QBP05844.1 hypothetical protein [Synechococcus phage S-B28]
MTATLSKLTGQDLIDHVKLHNDCCSKSEMCLDAGYVNKNGGPAFTDFYTALLEAKTDLNQMPEESQSGADWYDNLSEQDQLLYDQIEDMCPEFAKLTAEECQEFMDELSDIGITTAQQFEDAYYMQFDSYKAEREFAEELMCQVTPNLEDSPVFFAIDWQRVWDHSLSYDFSTIEFDGTTYFFHNN